MKTSARPLFGLIIMVIVPIMILIRFLDAEFINSDTQFFTLGALLVLTQAGILVRRNHG